MDAMVPDTLIWERVLRPHRSLPPRGFLIVIACLGVLSVAAGSILVWLGAWPVIGFFGLDVGIVYWAFRASYKSAKGSETVRLTRRVLTVDRETPSGQQRSWSFEPYWLRVRLERLGEDSNRLIVGSHGRRLSVGAFLCPAAREELADELDAALSRWRDLLYVWPDEELPTAAE